MKHLGLFEGIGGFSLAARWAGWETVAWCEWNEFGQKVLRHHFPEAEGFGDITKTDFTKYANTIDIITGGFPCQPYSQAGKRKGKEDERHLWPEMLRSIREVQPRWVVGENVFGLINWNGGMVFDEVQADLEAAGYEVWPYVLPACAVNAPHRRDRVWFVAYRNSDGCNQCNCQYEEQPSERGEYAQRNTKQISVDTKCIRRIKVGHDNGEFEKAQKEKCGEQQSSGTNSAQGWWRGFPTQSPICTGDDGISDRLDSITFPKWRNESIKAAGNAIVPQVAFEIFKAINQFEHETI